MLNFGRIMELFWFAVATVSGVSAGYGLYAEGMHEDQVMNICLPLVAFGLGMARRHMRLKKEREAES